MRINITVVLFAVLATEASARPVAFVGATSVMTEARPNQNTGMVGYTPFRRFAFHAHAATYRPALYYGGAAFSASAIRWNEESMQANVYLTGGYGLLRNDAAKHGAAHAALDMDAESRKYYVAVHHERLGPSVSHDLASSRFRIGYAPYLADMGGLHTWLLLQADRDYWTKRDDVTPMLRLFFQNVQWEIGVSFAGRLQMGIATEG